MDGDLAYCIVGLASWIHRDPELAARPLDGRIEHIGLGLAILLDHQVIDDVPGALRDLAAFLHPQKISLSEELDLDPKSICQHWLFFSTLCILRVRQASEDWYFPGRIFAPCLKPGEIISYVYDLLGLKIFVLFFKRLY